MSLEVEASVDLPRPPSEVRRHVLKRWEDAVKVGDATTKLLRVGLIGAGFAASDPGMALNAAEDVDLELAVGEASAGVVVETNNGLTLEYEFENLGGGSTRLRMIQRQTSFLARVPGAKRWMEKSMQLEVGRFQKWAAKKKRRHLRPNRERPRTTVEA